MDLFSKKQSYLGVDIGSASIKVVELVKKDNNPSLLTYGYTEEQTNIVKGGSLESQAKTAALLKKVCEKARVSTKQALAALPNFFVFSSVINLPATDDKNELESAINWEAKKFVPMPLEEVILDWKILSPEQESVGAIISETNAGQKPAQSESKGPAPGQQPPASSQTSSQTLSRVERPTGGPASPNQNQSPASAPNLEKLADSVANSLSQTEPQEPQANPQNPSPKNKEKPLALKSKKSDGQSLNILLTAAPKNLVKKYIDICQGAGLKLLSLETESFALARSLVGQNIQPVIIIDMGSLVSDIVIMERGIPVLSRSVDVGGHTITQSIMNVLNVDAARAEQFKRDFGAPLSAGLDAFSTPGKNASPTAGVPRAISQVLDSLMQEIRYSINLYQNQTSKKAEKIVLSGGSAFLPNFTNYLSSTLSIPVHIGNPWDRISYPTELKPVLENLAPRLAVCVGLALREMV